MYMCNTECTDILLHDDINIVLLGGIKCGTNSFGTPSLKLFLITHLAVRVCKSALMNYLKMS